MRDKEKRELDFLVTKEQTPWLSIETKILAENKLSPSLRCFQNQLSAEHVFQVFHNLPFVDQSCFDEKAPIIVSVRKFLSQLM